METQALELLNFVSETGQIQVRRGKYEFSVEVPVENNTFIQGADLLKYLNALLAVSEVRDTAKVQGAASIKALCINQREDAAPDYVALRKNEYPPLEVYLDAVTSDDPEVLALYLSNIKDIKRKYPKPEDIPVSKEVLAKRREL